MTKKTYTVSVDYSKSVESLIKKGKYDYVNSSISNNNFKEKKINVVEIAEVTLFGFNKSHSSKWVVNKLNSLGYRPATLKELLSLGAQHPDLQRKDWIVALGSGWRDPDGYLCVPVLRGGGSSRRLCLFHWGGGWHPSYRFLARKLDTSILEKLETKDTSEPFGPFDPKLLEQFNNLCKQADSIVESQKKIEQLLNRHFK